MKYAWPAATLLFCLSASSGLTAEEDVSLGARAFRACAACHSVEANRNMTGPSLAGLESQGRQRVELFALFRRDEIVRCDLERQDVGRVSRKSHTIYARQSYDVPGRARRKDAQGNYRLSQTDWRNVSEEFK